MVVVGEKSRDQVVLLHHMLSKASVKARPSVLWCYKKELDFSRCEGVAAANEGYSVCLCSHRKKRMKQLQKRIKSGAMDVREDDPFDLFVSSTDIRYCYYSETHKILGNTFGMCVLQVIYTDMLPWEPVTVFLDTGFRGPDSQPACQDCGNCGGGRAYRHPTPYFDLPTAVGHHDDGCSHQIQD